MRWRKSRSEATRLRRQAATTAAGTRPTSCGASSRSRATTEPDAEAAQPESSVDDRRADVHEQGRAALDEMTPSDEG